MPPFCLASTGCHQGGVARSVLQSHEFGRHNGNNLLRLSSLFALRGPARCEENEPNHFLSCQLSYKTIMRASAFSSPSGAQECFPRVAFVPKALYISPQRCHTDTCFRPCKRCFSSCRCDNISQSTSSQSILPCSCGGPSVLMEPMTIRKLRSFHTSGYNGLDPCLSSPTRSRHHHGCFSAYSLVPGECAKSTLRVCKRHSSQNVWSG